MQTDYYIEDLVHQTADLVVYRVLTRDQIPLALIRLKYEPEVRDKLQGKVFQNALAQLQTLSHSCLRPVLDGGLDPVDGYPWIAARWWDGVLIPNRVRDSDLTAEEFNRIQLNGEALIAALGPLAGTVSFTPASVVTCGHGEHTIDTFSIDYHSWFEAFARGVHPAAEADPYQRFNTLLIYLRRQTEHTSAPLATRANPPEPAAPIPELASSTASVFPLKIVFVLLTLLAAIGFFSWKFINKQPTNVAKQTTEFILPSEETIIVKPTPLAPPKPLPEIPPSTRPTNREAYAPVDPTSPYSLDGKVGTWITFHTKLSDIDEKGHLLVADSSIAVTLPPPPGTLAQTALRNEVTLWGFLSSPSLLRIVNPDDIKITYLLQIFYTIHDEKQIRDTLLEHGQIIPVQAVVTELTQSSSGKTLYLQFKEATPEFAAAIEIKNADPSLSKPYLESLVGKTIQVKGRPSKRANGSRLSIIVTKKSQIKVIE